MWETRTFVEKTSITIVDEMKTNILNDVNEYRGVEIVQTADCILEVRK